MKAIDDTILTPTQAQRLYRNKDQNKKNLKHETNYRTLEVDSSL